MEGFRRILAPVDFSELSEWDLLSTFSRLMRETLSSHKLHIDPDERPLRWYVDRLCALLELMKLGVVSAQQAGPEGDISISLRDEHAGDVDEIVRNSGFDDETAEGRPASNPASPGEASALGDSGGGSGPADGAREDGPAADETDGPVGR